ncbi:VOC family protein [Novosphingobium sp. BL-52-GroH]|uniref:VOC family protein n=1 Tax=Novosphingobium sp. BL-52-GroH TaxID=3349877 RepID=UPI00384C32B3
MALLGMHHLTVRSADLDATEAFAHDFGLLTVERSADRLVMRTGGGDAFAYVAQRADAPGFIGFAVEAESEADLRHAVERHGATPIRDLHTPGGGKAVSLTDPNGFRVDLVTGIARSHAAGRDPDLAHNVPGAQTRIGGNQHRRPLGPPHTYRLGHLGLFVTSFRETAAWYEARLGMIGSDVYHAPDLPQAKIVGFYRLNRGEDWVDHHMLALMQREVPDLHHASFEVQDYEAQFVAHRYLEAQGHELIWGVGRHPHGSHVFDVWRDPNGHRFETFSDTDLLNAREPTHVHDISTVQMDVWRSDPPDRYFA